MTEQNYRCCGGSGVSATLRRVTDGQHGSGARLLFCYRVSFRGYVPHAVPRSVPRLSHVPSHVSSAYMSGHLPVQKYGDYTGDAPGDVHVFKDVPGIYFFEPYPGCTQGCRDLSDVSWIACLETYPGCGCKKRYPWDVDVHTMICIGDVCGTSPGCLFERLCTRDERSIFN